VTGIDGDAAAESPRRQLLLRGFGRGRACHRVDHPRRLFRDRWCGKDPGDGAAKSAAAVAGAVAPGSTPFLPERSIASSTREAGAATAITT
jgi:hypothetical protein